MKWRLDTLTRHTLLHCDVMITQPRNHYSIDIINNTFARIALSLILILDSTTVPNSHNFLFCIIFMFWKRRKRLWRPWLNPRGVTRAPYIRGRPYNILRSRCFGWVWYFWLKRNFFQIRSSWAKTDEKSLVKRIFRNSCEIWWHF